MNETSNIVLHLFCVKHAVTLALREPKKGISIFDSVIPMTFFLTLIVFVSSAPGAPANFSHTVIAPSELHGPRVYLVWSRPQQENGIFFAVTI